MLILKLNNNDVNVSFNNFIDRINLIVDKYMPLKKVPNKEFKMRFKPWISHEIIDFIAKKNKLFNKYVKSKNAANKIYMYYIVNIKG